jgi:hypothetical protein
MHPHQHSKTLPHIQGGSNMTGTDYTLFTHKSVPVIFEPPCIITAAIAIIASTNTTVSYELIWLTSNMISSPFFLVTRRNFKPP